VSEHCSANRILPCLIQARCRLLTAWFRIGYRCCSRKEGVFAVKSQILHVHAQSRSACLKAGYLESVPGDHWKLPRTACCNHLPQQHPNSVSSATSAMISPKTVALISQWCLLLLLGGQQLNAIAVSDKRTLGQPRLRDCLALYDKLPFATDLPRGELIAPRLFLEPQYLLQPFGYVRNTYPEASMVQLPKIWRLGEYLIHVTGKGEEWIANVHVAGKTVVALL